MKNKIYLLEKEDRAYIAGFLEGDGSIFAQIVSRVDYRLKYQIRTTINFTQKKSRYWFLKELHEQLGCGTLRDRKDGCCELTITGNDQVKVVLETLIPYLRMKKRLAQLVLTIIRSLSKQQSPESFLESCSLVDQVASLTDSKKRTITTEIVRALLFPPV